MASRTTVIHGTKVSRSEARELLGQTDEENFVVNVAKSEECVINCSPLQRCCGYINPKNWTPSKWSRKRWVTVMSVVMILVAVATAYGTMKLYPVLWPEDGGHTDYANRGATTEYILGNNGDTITPNPSGIENGGACNNPCPNITYPGSCAELNPVQDCYRAGKRVLGERCCARANNGGWDTWRVVTYTLPGNTGGDILYDDIQWIQGLKFTDHCDPCRPAGTRIDGCP